VASVLQPARWRLLRNPSAVTGLVVLLVMVVLALFPAPIAPYEPNKQNISMRLQPPRAEHLLGTDQFGRDILSRLIHGTRISLLVGVVSVAVAAVLGVGLGVVSGFYGGVVDSLLMRLVDMLMAFPSIILALTIVAVLGPNIINAMVAVGIAMSPRMARLVRGIVLRLKEVEFVEAARAVGAGDLRIMFVYVLPNSLSTIIVTGTLMVAYAILVEANLSFLGLGTQPPTPSWGNMISDGFGFLNTAPWISTFSGLAIMVAVLGFNLLGDGLRDLLDPRLRSAGGG
jgi:peptide/nickel transport system permease protein